MTDKKIDYVSLRRKFPVKKNQLKKRKAAIKAIQHEYEIKRNELGLKAPAMKRGLLFYLILVCGLVALGSLVLSATGNSTNSKKVHISQINARKAMDALCIALGRFKFHVGRYPTNEEGLHALEAITPNIKGWFGPYIHKLNLDPWGRSYVYEIVPGEEFPILYSSGPDRRIGTTDDIMPQRKLFNQPFEDVTWTNRWVPYYLRGYVLAPDEATRKKLQEEVKKY
jgi:general secretion pathway protein G